VNSWGKKKTLTQCHNLAPSDFEVPQPVQEDDKKKKNQKPELKTRSNELLLIISIDVIKLVITVSSSISSSSSGTCGGLKKLKKLSHSSVLVIGLAFFDPFLGFFLRSFWVKHFPGYHSISVLQHTRLQKYFSSGPSLLQCWYYNKKNGQSLSA
jgi:hypothetical protein